MTKLIGVNSLAQKLRLLESAAVRRYLNTDDDGDDEDDLS